MQKPGIWTITERALRQNAPISALSFETRRQVVGQIRRIVSNPHPVHQLGPSAQFDRLADLVVEAGLQAYDIQAPIAVIEAAGGIVTDWQGGAAHQGGRVLAAANAPVHAAALAVLSRAP